MIEWDDPTPVVVDPCPSCGDELIRVKDGSLPPMDSLDARERRHCEATRTFGWRYCARLRTVDTHAQFGDT